MRAGVMCEPSEDSDENPSEITAADFYRCGLSGGADSSALRLKLIKYLGLPERMTAKALLGVINDYMTEDDFFAFFGKSRQ